MANAGVVTAIGGTVVAVQPGSNGTVNVTSGGALQTLALQAGSGAAQVNFNNGILRALANNQNFITGFSGTQLNIQSGGLIVDTAGFNVGTDTTSAFSGVGGLTTIGSGTLTLDGLNTYTGQTTVDAGTLAASGVNVFGANWRAAIRSHSYGSSGRVSCWSRRGRSSGSRFPSAGPTTTWGQSGSARPRA